MRKLHQSAAEVGVDTNYVAQLQQSVLESTDDASVRMNENQVAIPIWSKTVSFVQDNVE